MEKLNKFYPDSSVDFLLRKGNESLLDNHPLVTKVLIFDKKENKYTNLLKLIRNIRAEKYDYVINVQRFFTTGLMTALSGAKHTIGFDKNPLSIFFTTRIKHIISSTSSGRHEVQRNLKLIEKLTDSTFEKPKLYPSEADFKKVIPTAPYVCIAPASVWFTKQLPKHKWVELINLIPDQITVFLLGANGDFNLCEEIKSNASTSPPSALGYSSATIENRKSNASTSSPSALGYSSATIQNLAGQLSFLESAALMKNAKMNYVNDSAPLHLASAMNAPVTAFFCSTIPAFGFGPLSDVSHIEEIDYKLYCRPCGLHGYNKCPEGHFKCSNIDIKSPLFT